MTGMIERNDVPWRCTIAFCAINQVQAICSNFATRLQAMKCPEKSEGPLVRQSLVTLALIE